MIPGLLSQSVTILRKVRDEAGDVSEQSIGPVRAAIQGAKEYVSDGEGQSVRAAYSVWIEPTVALPGDAPDYRCLIDGHPRQVLSIAAVRDHLAGARIDHYKLVTE